MAQGKKSIVVYSDWDEYFNDLSDEEAGKLIKHFFDYVNDRNPILIDRYLEMAFKPIKNQLKRDLEKWEQTKKKRVEAGRAGGLKSGESRKQNEANEANEANASNVKQNEANEAVNVIICNSVLDVSDNVNDILLKKETKSIKEREIYFYNSLKPFLSEYDKELIRAFFDYWTEHGEKDKKMRFEKERSFDIKKRLERWKSNNKNFNNGKSGITGEPKKQRVISNLAEYFNNNGQTEISDTERELFEDTEFEELE